MNDLYSAVLADLRGRRDALQGQLRDVEAAIQGILRLVGENDGPPATAHYSHTPARQSSAASGKAPGRFSNISVRWAVLWHLVEDAHGPEKTGDIAAAILAGGYKTDAARFGNMVSAVLSSMKTKDVPEVSVNADGAYEVTEDGRQTWQLIRSGAKFRIATSASERPLLSVQ